MNEAEECSVVVLAYWPFDERYLWLWIMFSLPFS